MHEINREFRNQSDLDLGPIQPYDEMFGGYDPSAHVTDDFFQNKIAFIVLLNFPLTTLDQRLNDGQKWTRRQWAEARLAQRFSKRVPARVNLAIAQAEAESGRYIAEYNIWMHHLVDDKGDAPLPAEDATPVALESARPDQGRLRRHAERTRQAAQPCSRSWSASSPRPFPPPSSTIPAWIGIRSPTK